MKQAYGLYKKFEFDPEIDSFEVTTEIHQKPKAKITPEGRVLSEAKQNGGAVKVFSCYVPTPEIKRKVAAERLPFELINQALARKKVESILSWAGEELRYLAKLMNELGVYVLGIPEFQEGSEEDFEHRVSFMSSPKVNCSCCVSPEEEVGLEKNQRADEKEESAPQKFAAVFIVDPSAIG